MTSKSAINFRTTYILLGLAAASFGALALYVFFVDDKKPGAENILLATFHALDIKPPDVTGLEIERGSEKIVFSRQSDGRWRMTQPIGARADSDRVEAIVNELLAARNDDKAADVSADLATHGLDNPAVKITLLQGTRSTWLALGKTTIGGDQAVVYVLSADDPKTPHALRKKKLQALFKDKPSPDAGVARLVRDLDEFRTKKLLGERIRLEAAPIEIESITLTKKLPKGEQVVALSRSPNDQTWRFVAPPGYGDAATDVGPAKPNLNTIYNISSLLADVLSIEVHDMKDFLPAVHDLAALGLDPSSVGVLRIDIKRQDRVGTETLWISKGNVKTERDKVYVRYGGEAAAAQVNAEKPRIVRDFMDDPSVLRDRTLLKLNRDRIDALDVTLDKKTFELRKVNGHWKVDAGASRHDANDEVVTLIGKLLQPRLAAGFPPADAPSASLGFDQPAVEIKIWQDGVLGGASADSKEWPKVKDTPSVRLLFGKKEVYGFVYVRRFIGADRADFKIPGELLTLASKGRLDYVNIGLTSFDPGKVAKFSFLRNGETWEMERQAGDEAIAAARWTILAPAAHKGKHGNSVQIANILTSFTDTKPFRVIAEKPSADQLKAWGLDPAKPVFKLVLKFKDDKPAERTYYMGNPAPDALFAYTKTSLADYIFEWPLAKMELATKGQLLDPTLYTIELQNVKGLKLRGWVDPAKPGEPRTLVLERKAGGAWVAKSNAPVDDRKLEEFLANIAQPLALEQVVDKTGPKSEQGLELKQGALEIEIDLLEGKPVTLTLGGLVNKTDKQIFVTTNQAPGHVFTIDGERLLGVKDKLEALLRSEEKK